VSVADVASAYDVTTETVRRDLRALARAGVVRRVHGGAVPASALRLVELGVAERETAMAAEKDRIAAAAVGLLPPEGGSLVLDAGTTTGRLARLLPTDQDLTVVTNAVPVAAQLAGCRGIRLQLLGGRVRGVTHAAVGAETVRALGDIRVDVSFLGTNGLSSTYGLSTPNPDEAAVKRAMAQAGRRVVVLADSAKIGREDLVRFASVDAVHVLVTDDGIDGGSAAELQEHGVEVVVA